MAAGGGPAASGGDPCMEGGDQGGDGDGAVAMNVPLRDLLRCPPSTRSSWSPGHVLGRRAALGTSTAFLRVRPSQEAPLGPGR